MPDMGFNSTIFPPTAHEIGVARKIKSIAKISLSKGNMFILASCAYLNRYFIAVTRTYLAL